MEVARLKQGIVKHAFETLNWPLLHTHLDAIALDNQALESLLGHLRRTSSLVIRYPDDVREDRRNVFLDTLSQYVRDVLGEGAYERLSQEIPLIDRIQRGYRGILDVLGKSAISQMPPDIRVSACISRAVHQYRRSVDEYQAEIQTLDLTVLPQGRLLKNEHSVYYSLDDVIETIVSSLSTTLIMEAHKNRWLDGHRCVVLPGLPPVAEAERSEAGMIEVLAIFWERWQRMEERRRFVGGAFEDPIDGDLPPDLPEGVRQFSIYTPPEEEFFDYAANQRLMDMLGQNFTAMYFETDVDKRTTGIDDGASLLPKALVSVDEAFAATALSSVLSYSIVEDEGRPGGLRFVEWVRGYAVLQALARQHNTEGKDADELCFSIGRDDLTAVLQKCGLERQWADLFIERVTLRATSRDLFDCPLIKMDDGSLKVFAPALLTANLARVILSVISSLGEPLESKGRAFEQSILSFLQGMGFPAQTFKVNRSGQDYQYDVVLPWRDYVFVFECKNHSLSNNNPVQAYYFALGIRSDVKQVNRLAEALRSYPEILSEQCGIDVATKTLVPCVLNALTYSRPGTTEGVYVTDASVLKRFFEEPQLCIKIPYKMDNRPDVLHLIRLKSLWSSERPTPEDLMMQLDKPFQLELLRKHTEMIVSSPIVVGNAEVYAAKLWNRGETSIESFAAFAGASPEDVREQVDAFGKQVAALKLEIADEPNELQ